MRTLLLLFAITLTITGCGKQISDFVTGGDKRPGDDADLPSVSTSNPIGVKVSPGANLVSGAQVESRFAITPSQRTAKGSQIKNKFTFHQNRPK